MLTRISKRNFFHNYFEDNLCNIKRTWESINNLLGRKRKAVKHITSLKRPGYDQISYNSSELPDIINKYFSSLLAIILPPKCLTHIRNFLNIFQYHVMLLLSQYTKVMMNLTHPTTDPYQCFQSLTESLKKWCIFAWNHILKNFVFSMIHNMFSWKAVYWTCYFGNHQSNSNKIINMDEKLYTCGILIDLQKAFDTVDHSILLKKLEHYGIRGIVNDWFTSYLTSRKQITEISPLNISKKATVLSGVPQGSVLGPLLFLIYINDICNSCDQMKFYLFVDDTNLIYADIKLKSLKSTVNDELCKLYH